ncbi:hypothetical protein MP228_009493 [Amoeboaphelidium protococcarum]|nr:hypothetical protein MP228_009493 [Amoeboaphelidium protococcarum]
MISVQTLQLYWAEITFACVVVAYIINISIGRRNNTEAALAVEEGIVNAIDGELQAVGVEGDSGADQSQNTQLWNSVNGSKLQSLLVPTVNHTHGSAESLLVELKLHARQDLLLGYVMDQLLSSRGPPADQLSFSIRVRDGSGMANMILLLVNSSISVNSVKTVKEKRHDVATFAKAVPQSKLQHLGITLSSKVQVLADVVGAEALRFLFAHGSPLSSLFNTDSKLLLSEMIVSDYAVNAPSGIPLKEYNKTMDLTFSLICSMTYDERLQCTIDAYKCVKWILHCLSHECTWSNLALKTGQDLKTKWSKQRQEVIDVETKKQQKLAFESAKEEKLRKQKEREEKLQDLPRDVRKKIEAKEAKKQIKKNSPFSKAKKIK